MGSLVSRQAGRADDASSASRSEHHRGSQDRRRGKKRKRNREESEGDSGDDDSNDANDSMSLDQLMNTPKKMRLRTTSSYIYEKLFVQGTNHDVAVEAFGHEWKLHKLYLCQSAYFSSMFSGSWRESRQKTISIKIADPNVTRHALDIALGSLYQDEITVEPASVVPVLAAATLLQCDGLLEQCYVTMIDTVNIQTVVDYWKAARDYGAIRVEEKCLEWLMVNLMSSLPDSPTHLRRVPPELMKIILESSGLFVMQTEFSIYILLLEWLFLRLHPDWEGSATSALFDSHKYFQNLAKTGNGFFLESESAASYVTVFRQLRLKHMINHHTDVEMLLSDKVVPNTWMHSVYRDQWRTLVRTDQGADKGPGFLSEEEFDQLCSRYGRMMILAGPQQLWRWTGFNMGLDLIVSHEDSTILLRRCQSVSSHEALVSTHETRNIMCRLTIACLNEQKQVKSMQSTGILEVSLTRTGSHALMSIWPDMLQSTVLLSFNIVVSQPLSSAPDTYHVDEDNPSDDLQLSA